MRGSFALKAWIALLSLHFVWNVVAELLVASRAVCPSSSIGLVSMWLLAAAAQSSSLLVTWLVRRESRSKTLSGVHTLLGGLSQIAIAVYTFIGFESAPALSADSSAGCAFLQSAVTANVWFSTIFFVAWSLRICSSTLRGSRNAIVPLPRSTSVSEFSPQQSQQQRHQAVDALPELNCASPSPLLRTAAAAASSESATVPTLTSESSGQLTVSISPYSSSSSSSCAPESARTGQRWNKETSRDSAAVASGDASPQDAAVAVALAADAFTLHPV